MMNSKIKSIALTCITSVSVLGAAHAQDKEVADKPAAEVKVEAEVKAVIETVLGVGSVAPALKGLTYVQGDEVKSLDEKGKLYIIECWASWCGPCVAVIPHMNELHKKYSDKGLTIIGMNVWEEGIEKTEAFVKGKGDGMSYRVAYSGAKGSEFETDWLKASNTKGIPQAFVISEGKIIYKGHPGTLDEKNIELMMSGEFNPEEFAKQQLIESEKAQAFSQKLKLLFRAGDWKAVIELALTDEQIKGKADAAGLLSQAYQNLDYWPAQAVLLKDIVAGKYGEDTKATSIVSYSILSPEINDTVTGLAKELEKLYATEGEPKAKDYYGRIAQSRILFIAGKKEESKQKLEEIIKDANEIKSQRGMEQFIKKLEDTLKSVTEGSYPPYK